LKDNIEALKLDSPSELDAIKQALFITAMASGATILGSVKL
jgi:hypothetical protein